MILITILEILAIVFLALNIIDLCLKLSCTKWYDKTTRIIKGLRLEVLIARVLIIALLVSVAGYVWNLVLKRYFSLIN